MWPAGLVSVPAPVSLITFVPPAFMFMVPLPASVAAGSNNITTGVYGLGFMFMVPSFVKVPLMVTEVFVEISRTPLLVIELTVIAKLGPIETVAVP